MYLLDTNVLSEIMSATPDRHVAAWVKTSSHDELYTASICQAEVFAGIAILPRGRRRSDLESAARAIFSEDFGGRIWPFDSSAALAFAEILLARRSAGRPIASFDLLIASIAKSRGATMVTRDVGGFEGCGLALVNPWTTSSI